MTTDEYQTLTVSVQAGPLPCPPLTHLRSRISSFFRCVVDLWAAIMEEVGTNGGEQERRQRRGFQSRSVREVVVRALANTVSNH
jgi:hypothetical protein